MGEVEVACSEVLQLTESDVQSNMIIIVVVILSITGSEHTTNSTQTWYILQLLGKIQNKE